MRRISLFLLVLGLAGAAHGIELRSVGVKGGYGLVTTNLEFVGEELFDPDGEWQPSAGVFAQWRRGPRARFEILTELWWIRPAFEQGGEKYTVDLIGVPLLLRSAVNQHDPELYVIFGPSIEFVASKDEHPILDEFRSVALAGQAGMGVEKRVNKHLNVLFEFRFSAELTNLYDKPSGSTLQSLTYRWLNFRAGVRF